MCSSRFSRGRKTYMNHAVALNVPKPTTTNYRLTVKAQNITLVYKAGYTLVFFIVGKTISNATFFLVLYSMKADCCLSFQGCQTFEYKCKSSEKN
jgi:hypothetical protein